MQPTPIAPVWTAVSLASIRTEVLRSLDLARGPAPAAAAVRAELAARHAESKALSDVPRTGL
jgi:hypothetical protein